VWRGESVTQPGGSQRFPHPQKEGKGKSECGDNVRAVSKKSPAVTAPANNTPETKKKKKKICGTEEKKKLGKGQEEGNIVEQEGPELLKSKKKPCRA